MPIPIQFSKGNTTEERLASIETTLRHFSRRLVRVAETILPPIPIFARERLLESDGIAFRGIIPYKGSVGLCAVNIGHYVIRPVSAHFKFSNSKGAITTTFTCQSPITTEYISYVMTEPTVLEVILEPYNAVEDILIAVLTYPELSVTNREQHILDDVLKSYELSEDLEV